MTLAEFEAQGVEDVWRELGALMRARWSWRAERAAAAGECSG